MAISKPTGFNVFIDSDGVIADFDKALKDLGAHPDDFKLWPGSYLWLEEILGARVGLEALKKLDDANLIRVWVATKTPSGTPYAYTEKVLWYRKHFPWLDDRVILTHDKSILGGKNDFLLDDRPHKANADQFTGTFVFFDPVDPLMSWERFVLMIVDRLEQQNASQTSGAGILKM